MDEIITSGNLLREVAHYVEETALQPLEDYVEPGGAGPEARFLFGDSQRFPREAPEDPAAADGFAALRAALQAAVRVLYALAGAVDRGHELSAAAIAPVRAYIEAYLADHPGGDPGAAGGKPSRPSRRARGKG